MAVKKEVKGKERRQIKEEKGERQEKKIGEGGRTRDENGIKVEKGKKPENKRGWKGEGYRKTREK